MKIAVALLLPTIFLLSCFNRSKEYTVTYDPNAIIYRGTVPVDQNTYPAGYVVTIPAPPPIGKYPPMNLTIPSQNGIPGSEFDGWNTRTDGKGTTYYPGSTFVMPKHDVTLYVKWKSVAMPGVVY